MHSHKVGATAGKAWAKAEKLHPCVLISSHLAWATFAIWKGTTALCNMVSLSALDLLSAMRGILLFDLGEEAV